MVLVDAGRRGRHRVLSREARFPRVLLPVSVNKAAPHAGGRVAGGVSLAPVPLHCFLLVGLPTPHPPHL